MVREELIDRLVCAKYIFESGVETLERGAPYASGLAVLSFQDAVELLLRAIAEHIHAQLKENASFNQILDEIEKSYSGRLTHRSALNQLNKARVNFKHLGLAPRDEDTRKFRRDLEGFFPSATKAFFDLDFSSLSLSSLIAHRRTRNWTKQAEECLSAGEYDECVNACAVAVGVFQANCRRGDEDALSRRLRPHVSGESLVLLQAVSGLVEEVQKQLDTIYYQLDLMGRGISYNDYLRFRDLAPAVTFTGDGRPHLGYGRSAATYEEALFCIGFARGLILKLQNQYRRNRFAPQPGERRFRTTKPSSIVAYPPKDGRQAEVIETIDCDVELSAFGNRSLDMSAYIAIHYQGDCAYIESSAVELIEGDLDTHA